MSDEEAVAEVSYPLKVDYCGECSMPLEYCDNGPVADKCREWMRAHLPDLFARLHSGDGGWARVDGRGDGDARAEAEQTDDAKKRQKRGGKGASKATKASGKAAAADKRVTLQRSVRGKAKSVTVVKGLHACGVELKVAAKYFAQQFACGSSVTAADEIVIQGDVKDDLIDMIPEKWPQVDADNIEDLGDQKR